MGKLLQRITECTRGTESTILMMKDAKEKAARRAVARKKLDHMKAMFDKYDLDKDGMLNRKEMLKYAKSEFEFDVPSETVDMIFKVLVQEDAKGVRKDVFQRLKVAVGIAREKVKDGERRAERLEREKKIVEMKEELQEKVKEAARGVEAAEESVGKAEEPVQSLPIKATTMTSAEMLALADETEEVVTEAKKEVTSAKNMVASLSEDVDPDLQVWLADEVKKLDTMMSVFAPRLTKAATMLARFRDDTKKKEVEELYALEKEALDIIKFHQRAKKLKNEEVFSEIDTNKDDKIDQAEFFAFFKNCEREPKKDGDAKEGEEENAGKESSGPSHEELQRLFNYLDEDDE